MIRNRLVIGVNDKRTKGRLLREEALTLNKAIEMCRSSEITSKQLKRMEKEVKKAGEELSFLRKSQAQHARGKRSQKFSKASNKPIAIVMQYNASTVGKDRDILRRKTVQLLVSSAVSATDTTIFKKCACQKV